MIFVITGIIAVAVIALTVIIIMKSKKKTPVLISENNTGVKIAAENREMQEFIIPIQMLPAEAVPDENKLAEITDSKVLAYVNNLIPGLFQMGNAVILLKLLDHEKYKMGGQYGGTI